jgi:CubicO group peptidase (beta-lactamase class C family)
MPGGFEVRRFACILISSVLLCGLLCPPVSKAQEPQARTNVADRYADKIRAFEEYVRASMPKDRIPGMTVGFTLGDYTRVEGFGYADLENKTPAKAESAYRLASITRARPRPRPGARQAFDVLSSRPSALS